MGFISYLEDIQKVRDDLCHLAGEVHEFSETDVHARRRALEGQVRNVMGQLDRLLELATDPQIELADDLAAIRDERRRLEIKSAELEAKLQQTETLAASLKTQLKEAAADKRKANAAFDKLASEDFRRALDMYSPTGMTAKR